MRRPAGRRGAARQHRVADASGWRRGRAVNGHGGQAASAAQYVLLGGFAAVASGISSQGLTGFARANMALSGPWPYLLFLALDGAAGVCAVLLARRAARAERQPGPADRGLGAGRRVRRLQLHPRPAPAGRARGVRA